MTKVPVHPSSAKGCSAHLPAQGRLVLGRAWSACVAPHGAACGAAISRHAVFLPLYVPEDGCGLRNSVRVGLRRSPWCLPQLQTGAEQSPWRSVLPPCKAPGTGLPTPGTHSSVIISPWGCFMCRAIAASPSST